MIIGFMIFKAIVYDKTASNNFNEKLQFSIGVSVHFIEPDVDEVNKLREAGFNIIRTDLKWEIVEKTKGVYDFSRYDKLVKSMKENNIKILFILDYSNMLYDKGLSPYTNNGRKAFANFAKAAAEHYKSENIIWEIWNEPNVTFGKPNPNVNNYYKLAVETAKTIRYEDENAFIIAPALSMFDYSYLNKLGKLGLFQYIDAVSIHPYRDTIPETVISDYAHSRKLVQKYPHNENIKILSGEWGYSTSGKNMNDMKQAQYCIRQYLINIMCGSDISIWYDWKDDGINKSNGEHNFGVVYNDLTLKPAYYAIKTMNSTINGYKYIKRIDVGSSSDYVLMFEKDNNVIYALWTTGKSHNISIDLKSNKVKVIEQMGNSYDDRASNKKYKINIDESVRYILN